jgi:hypothetical protein
MDSPLGRECRVFSRYLVGGAPSDYVLSRYREGVRALGLERPGPGADPVEPALLRVGALHPALTRLADAYSRVRLPESLLRRRLVLLLAIQESTAASRGALTTEGPGGPGRSVLRLLPQGVATVLATAVSLPLFLVLRAVAARRAARATSRVVVS